MNDTPTITHWRQKLKEQERTLGPQHPATLMSLNYLAGLLADKHDLPGAESLYRRALAGRERTLGPQHLDTQASQQYLFR